MRRAINPLLLALVAVVLAAPTPISVFPAPAGSPWTTGRKTVDETVVSTTVVQADDVLTFALAADTKYAFRAFIRFDSPAAADFKYARTCTGTQSAQGFTTIHFFDNAISDDQGGICATAIDVVVTFTSGAGGMIHTHGVIHQSGTAGVWTFLWAQNTSDPGNTTVRAGSYLEWMIIP